MSSGVFSLRQEACDRQGLGRADRANMCLILEIVFTRAAPAFDNLFMGCVFNINTVHKTVEKLTFQAFYRSSQLSLNLLKKE